MPMTPLCVNNEWCKGVAAGGGKYCECCLEAQRIAKEQNKIDRRYELDTTRFSSTRNWLNYWGTK